MQTTPEQAQEARSTYRASCSLRRKGKVIEEKTEKGWTTLESYKFVNAAKRASRILQGRGQRLYVAT